MSRAGLRLPSRIHQQDEVAANLARRNLTKGQQAMAYVFVYPEGKRGKRSPETGQLSKQRISDARKVYHHSRKLAV